MNDNECERWKALDRTYNTDPSSPLHHDNRCRQCLSSGLVVIDEPETRRLPDTVGPDVTIIAAYSPSYDGTAPDDFRRFVPNEDDEYERCPACGDSIDYCQGHGEIGDPVGFAILVRHDADDHTDCHPDAYCKES